MGLEAVPVLGQEFNGLFLILYDVSQAVFVLEITIRIFACAPAVRTFFQRPENTFDLLITSASLIPEVGSFAVVARLLRVLRVLRVLRAFSVSHRLRAFTARLSEAFDEAIYSAVVVFILAYIFTGSGHYLFAEIDPIRWGDLGSASLSVFYLLLLQDVPSYVSPLIASHRGSVVYFVTFYFVFASLGLSVLAAAISQSCLKGREEP
jgi:voltage-gated sodium channel